MDLTDLKEDIEAAADRLVDKLANDMAVLLGEIVGGPRVVCTRAPACQRHLARGSMAGSRRGWSYAQGQSA